MRAEARDGGQEPIAGVHRSIHVQRLRGEAHSRATCDGRRGAIRRIACELRRRREGGRSFRHDRRAVVYICVCTCLGHACRVVNVKGDLAFFGGSSEHCPLSCACWFTVAFWWNVARCLAREPEHAGRRALRP